MKKLKAILLLPFIAFMQFCNSGKGFDFKNSEIDEIQYFYQDASVLPHLARSYTIVLKSENVSVLTLLHDSIFPSSQEKFNNILNLLQSGKLKCDTTANNDGCPGGDSESLSCLSKGKVVFTGDINYCGDKRSGTLKGNIEPAASAILNLIPDLDKILE